MDVRGAVGPANQGEQMRQASWIAFLLMTLGLLSYSAAVDQQETAAPSTEVAGLEGGLPPTPKP
jgi:hypothetical protein